MEEIKEFDSLLEAFLYLLKEKLEEENRQLRKREQVRSKNNINEDKCECPKQSTEHKSTQSQPVDNKSILYKKPSISIVDKNTFRLNHYVKDTPIHNYTDLVFADNPENGLPLAGITNEQLIYVLGYRFRNDNKKIALLEQLLQ